MKTKLTTFVLVGVVLPWLALAQLAPGEPITGGQVKTFLNDLGNFLVFVGIAGAIITLIISGIMYFTSGFKAESAKKAKELFKNAVIGILIILASGVIINTIDVIIRREFFQ